MIKFIYFDIGDVMFGGKALTKIANNLDIPVDDFIAVYLKYNDMGLRGKIKTQDLWDIYKNALSIKQDLPNYAEYFVSQLDPIEEMHEVAYKLSNDYKIGLLTNLYDGYLDEMIKQKKIPSIDYTAIITSYETSFIKPEQEIYTIALKKSGYQPDEILFIDDQDKNVTAAIQSGWKSIKFSLDNRDNSLAEIKRVFDK